jgi:hypothetical protein
MVSGLQDCEDCRFVYDVVDYVAKAAELAAPLLVDHVVAGEVDVVPGRAWLV